MSDTNPVDGVTARALDHYNVPPLSAAFTDRLIAKALEGEEISALPPLIALRRDQRRGWVRGRRLAVGVAVFSLMSAAAAATGVFGDVAKNVPVIGPLIAIVAPAPKPKAIITPKPKHASAAPKLVPPLVVVEEPSIEVAEPIAGEILTPRVRRQIRREMIAQRVVDQIERNEALGITPTPEERAKFAERLAKIPPVQRVALIKRVRDIRRERLAKMTLEAGEIPQANIPLLEAETRRQFREDRLRLREERRLRWMQREEPQGGSVVQNESVPQN
ncbi:MAG: hypothetical protein AABY88_02095 [Pseudomonadota bacterium]